MRIVLIIFLLTCYFISPAQVHKFEGVVYAENGKRLPGALIVIRQNQDSLQTDEKGYFSFTRSEDKNVLIDISKTGFRTIGIYLGSTKPDSRLTRISLCQLCKYDSSNGVCPVCLFSDKVVKIVYGLPYPPLRTDVYYAGSCTVTCCDPQYYCLRDKKEF